MPATQIPKVIVNGAAGRMGQVTVKAITDSPHFELVGALGRNDNLAANIQQHKANIVIDFTNSKSAYENAIAIIEAGAKPIIGSSGLLAEQINELSKRCTEKKLGGIIAPNFSLGAIIMMKYAAEIARYFSAVEIIEMHHDQKLDSPSGTSIKSAELIAKNLASSSTITKVNSHETLAGARGANHHHIPIHSIRLPGFVAHQCLVLLLIFDEHHLTR